MRDRVTPLHKSLRVLGISASHNGAACIASQDGVIVAVQEERLTRVKRQRVYGAQPSLAVAYCLQSAGIEPEDLDLVVLSAQGRAQSVEQDLRLNPQLQVALRSVPTLSVPHHLAHAASAFVHSGFDDAAVLVIDGMGSPVEDLPPAEQRAIVEPADDAWETISIYRADRTAIEPLEKHVVPDGRWLLRGRGVMPRFRSLGGMYSAAAAQIFGDPMEAGQVMGLAPFGRAVYPHDEFFSVGQGRFTFHDGVPARFDHDRRWPDCANDYKDLARSTQEALEEAVLLLARRATALSGNARLCYAGGVALNCVANERVLRESGVDALFIVPAAEDSGAAVGAAACGVRHLLGEYGRWPLASDAHGRMYSATEIDVAIGRAAAVIPHPSAHALDEAVERICGGQIGGWFQGRSELGPRALGQRSILADPRSPLVKDDINGRIKRRASFRPFAASVLRDEVHHWFELDGRDPESPFMLRACAATDAARDQVPAVIHVDGTSRLQTVTARNNPELHQLLVRFWRRTGIPLLLNTSFNGRHEPIVETPDDALAAMVLTGLDFCVLHDRVVVRDPAVSSILDLRPRLESRTLVVETDLTRGGMDANLPDDARLWLVINTRWGVTRPQVPAQWLTILRLIDGDATGWTVLERLAEEIGQPADAATLIEALAGLHRMSVVRLDVRGCGASSSS